jgi:hypothetical protein
MAPIARATWAASACQSAVLALLLLHTLPALAQDDEDHQLLCPLLTPDLVHAILPDVIGHGACKVRCTGCGCKGGPGYRDQAHNCVGYANIIQKCGPPPHLACAAECAPVREGCDHGRVWLKNALAEHGLSVQFTGARPLAASRELSPAQQDSFQEPNQSRDRQTEQRQNDDARH